MARIKTEKVRFALVNVGGVRVCDKTFVAHLTYRSYLDNKYPEYKTLELKLFEPWEAWFMAQLMHICDEAKHVKLMEYKYFKILTSIDEEQVYGCADVVKDEVYPIGSFRGRFEMRKYTEEEFRRITDQI